MTKLIARLWHGTTRANQSDQFLDYILETGARDIRSTQGNVGLAILRSREPDIAQFWMVSTWEDMESIRAFAGDQPEKPRYYPLDADYLLELESMVFHCDVVEIGGRLSRIADRFETVYNGSPWYGENLRNILEATTPEQAVATPAPTVHSILEIVGHIYHWREFLVDRLSVAAGLSGSKIDKSDWCVQADANPETWIEFKAAFHVQHRRLIQRLRHLDDRLLVRQVPDRRYTYERLLNGVLEHDLYHFGQIALLQKFTGGPKG